MSLYEIEKGYSKDSILFEEDGTLYACTYSYEISSYGEIELTKEETRELYLVMKKYFEGENK